MSEKFIFVDEEETNKETIEDSIEIKPIPEKISVEKNEEKQEETKVNLGVTKRFYFSFEARIVVSILIVLVFFGAACFLGMKVINHTTVQRVRYVENAYITNEVSFKEEKCLSEDEEIKAKDIKSIKVILEYASKYDRKINHKNYYKVKAIISRYDKENNSLLSQKKVNLINKKALSIKDGEYTTVEAIDIDYAKYKKQYVDSDDVDTQLEIVFYLIENNETRKISSTSIPLSKSNFKLKDYKRINSVKETHEKVNIWDTYALVYGISSSILVLISLILIYKTTRLVLKVTNNKNEYEEALDALLKEYDSIITVAGEGFESVVPEEKEVVKFDSFEELAKVSEEVDKPIIYDKINNVKSEFTLEDDKKLYKYVMKEVDLTEEDKKELENK